MDCHNCNKCVSLETHSWRYRCMNCNCPNYFHKSFCQTRTIDDNVFCTWIDNIESTSISQLNDFKDAMEMAKSNNLTWLPIGIGEHNISAFVEKYQTKLGLVMNETNKLKKEMLIASQIPTGDCNINCDKTDGEQTEPNAISKIESEFKCNRDSNYFGFGEVEEVDTSEVCLYCQKPFEEDDEFCVRITHSGTASWHISCFRCFKCKGLLVDFHYYWQLDGNEIYCMRHFDDLKIIRCGSCDKPIFDTDFTIAMDDNHHTEHFTCIECNVPLAGEKFVVKGNGSHCLKCFEKKFANVCDRCNETIKSDCKDLTFETRHWHETCFNCDSCKETLVDKSFATKDKELFCPTCYDNKFSMRCFGCNNIFQAGAKKFEYNEKSWHEECFRCGECNESIGSKSFVPKNDKTLCVRCYEEKYAQKCSKCKEIIRKGGITYNCEPWHKECFLCTNCDKVLANTKFTKKDDKPYCAECFSELFSKRCKKCEKPITGFSGCKFISLEDDHWHTECFNCARCEVNLVGKGFLTHNLEILCAVCGQVETKNESS